MSPKGDFLLIIQDSAQVPCVTTILRRVRLPMLLCFSRRRTDVHNLRLEAPILASLVERWHRAEVEKFRVRVVQHPPPSAGTEAKQFQTPRLENGFESLCIHASLSEVQRCPSWRLVSRVRSLEQGSLHYSNPTLTAPTKAMIASDRRIWALSCTCKRFRHSAEPEPEPRGQGHPSRPATRGEGVTLHHSGEECDQRDSLRE
jgi:hypothetical protein